MPDEEKKTQAGAHLIEVGKINIPEDGADVLGFGKAAKAIPPEVYQQGAATVISTFDKLIAPFTETTSGVGRYIRQKFDTMVGMEKAVATYTLAEALQRAAKRHAGSIGPITPGHLKSFVTALEEASKETEPTLHEMWTNLLASQLVDPFPRPHFVNLLSQFGPAEAQLFEYLLSKSEANDRHGSPSEAIALTGGLSWLRKNTDEKIHPWTASCTLLCNFGLAETKVLTAGKYQHLLAGGFQVPLILYRTDLGDLFLAAVARPEIAAPS